MTRDSDRPIGALLRQRREELGISLEQAQVDTRIRARYLRALEDDEIAALPDPVVGRGFLRNYAAYLGLDAQQMVQAAGPVGAGSEAQVPASDETNPFAGGLTRPVALHELPGRSSRWRWLLPAAALAVALLAVLGWWGYPRLKPWLAWAFAREATATLVAPATESAELLEATTPVLTRTPTAESASPVPAVASDTPRPTLTRTHTPPPPPSPSPTPTVIYTGIFLELAFTETSWIQVTVDGVRQFQGELGAEARRSWYARERLELRIGNAGAVTITLNGQRLGTLGAPGEVVDRVFEKVGDLVGAATLTPSPTSTRTPRGTRPPTATPSPTGTPTPGP